MFFVEPKSKNNMIPERTKEQEEEYFTTKFKLYRSLVDVSLLIIDRIQEQKATDSDAKVRIALEYVNKEDYGDGVPYLHNIDEHASDDNLDDPTQMCVCATQTVNGTEYVASLSIQWRPDTGHIHPADIWFDLAECTYVLESIDDCCFEIIDVLCQKEHDLNTAVVDLYDIDPRKETKIIELVAADTVYDAQPDFEDYYEDCQRL